MRAFNTTGYSCVAALAAAAMVAGCAKKPPECADPQTVETIHQIAIDNTKEVISRSAVADAFRDDPAKLQEAYYRGVKAQLVNVVSDGYNEQARMNSCRGKLTVTTVAGQEFSREVTYSTQLTQDKDGGFLVRVEAFAPFVNALAKDLTTYYSERRYTGEWHGTYSCGGIDGAAEGPQGPFTMPVTVVVNDQSEAKLERTTRGGGVETLSGRVMGWVQLRGGGRNSPDDTWQTYLEGEVTGLQLAAKGRIETMQGRPLRECAVNLRLATP
jgi:hypothetical protein